MPVLSVNLLGPFTVTKDNHPVAFAYEKVRALLAYLCAEPSGPIRPRAWQACCGPTSPSLPRRIRCGRPSRACAAH
jgi:hypothetical protein